MHRIRAIRAILMCARTIETHVHTHARAHIHICSHGYIRNTSMRVFKLKLHLNLTRTSVLTGSRHIMGVRAEEATRVIKNCLVIRVGLKDYKVLSEVNNNCLS